MEIKKLTLQNFRNYENEDIYFKCGINVLTGANAQGKTNIAEAVFFLCTGYSPRANRDRLIIKTGENHAMIQGVAESCYGEITVRVEFSKSEKKSIYVNNLKVLKVGDILGNIHSVFFNPAELKLVQESPEDRRRFMNISLSQMSKTYYYALMRYNKILEQRNNLLKCKDESLIRETLPVWDIQLSKEASKIICKRQEFLNTLSPIAKEKHALLSNGKEVLKMMMENNYIGEEDEIEKKIYQALQRNLERDLKLGFTGIGPHRDDIKFLLNNEDVKIYGSQGQQRTVALSIKLAETELFYMRFGEYPILILDDVLSELDKFRQRRLISIANKMQTIFTTTDIPKNIFKGREYSNMMIENGKIKNKIL